MTSPDRDSQPGAHPAPVAIGGETHQIVRSPEQVELHLPVAGPASRMLAYGIDFLVILVLVVAIVGGVLLGLITSGGLVEWLQEPLSQWLEDVDPEDPESIFSSGFFLLLVLAFLVVQVLAEWGYFVVSEMTTGGSSIGKRVVGLRVVRDGGLPLDLRSSLMRNLLRIADILPSSYLAGLVTMVASREGKRLGDLAAGTLVVRLDRPEAAPPIEVDLDGRAGEFRFDHAEVAQLGRAERTLLRRTLRRLSRLEGSAAQSTLARSSTALARRIGREPPTPPDQLPFLEALYAATRRP